MIDHFLCKLCGYVVHKPKECPQCAQTFCHDCVQDRILSTKIKWQCPTCQSVDQVNELHRSVKEVLDVLVFKCPKCGGKRSYSDMETHIQEC